MPRGPVLSEQTAIPILVTATRQDDVEAVSRTLRNGGQPARCEWIAEDSSLPDALARGEAELLVVFAARGLDDLPRKAGLRDKLCPDLSLLAVSPDVDEGSIARAMAAGAQDLVSLGQPERFQAVARREIRAGRTARELRRTQNSAEELQGQLKGLVQESTASMVYVAEGIIVDLNRAWLELFGYADAGDLVGEPVMDIFDTDSRAAIKGALVACAEGKWSGPRLRSRVLSSDGSSLPVDVDLEMAIYDGDPCVRMAMYTDSRLGGEAGAEDGDGRDPVTGVYRRERFVEMLEKRLAESPGAGVLVLAYVKPDEISDTRDHLDPIASDQLLLDFARLIKRSVKEHDIYGQFGGDLYMVLLARGTVRDTEAWAENLRRSVTQHVFEVGDKSMSMSCSIGLAVYDPQEDELEALIFKAQRAFSAARNAGGDRTVLGEQEGETQTREPAVSAEELKNALMRDQFRLVYQPVASLQGQSQPMLDVLIRMLGNDGNEIMPAEFLPAAEQHGMMKAIDRWVIASAIAFCAQQKPAPLLFIRISPESISDPTLPGWIQKQALARRAQPKNLVFQITELNAEEKLKESKSLVSQLKAFNCRIAIEHFGLGHRPLQMLEHVSADYIKVDGSLMEGLTTNTNARKKVGLYIEAAKAKNIETIAERVEDANTMAMLWQLGVEFIQGYYVQGPEVIVLEAEEPVE